MKPTLFLSLLLTLAFVLQPFAVFAFETDQYNLPPVPLADIGDEVSEHLEQTFRDVVSKLNKDISAHQVCIETPKRSGCGSAVSERKKLAYLRSPEAVAYLVFKALGDGIFPFTKIGYWMDTHKFRSQPARYKTSYAESIFVTLPTDYLTISPTVNLYGAQFGVDKIEHFFQEGYNYYKIYNQAVASGAKPEDATKKAVKWGQHSERTFYGTLVSGVYSNADLCSNYVGLKFYLGLTKAIEINGTIRPALLTLKEGAWLIDETRLRQELIRPFISEHLNEALNPSIFAFNLLPSVRRIVKKQSCPQWLKAYPGLTKASLESKTASLTLWNGEDYGFTDSKKFVTIQNTCFSTASIQR